MEKVDRPLGPVVVDIAGTSLTDEEVKILQNPMVGMVILFTRNYENREQLHNLTHDIHSLRNPSLHVCIKRFKRINKCYRNNRTLCFGCCFKASPFKRTDIICVRYISFFSSACRLSLIITLFSCGMISLTKSALFR